MSKLFTVQNVTEIKRIGESKEIETAYIYQAKSAGGVVFTETIRDADATPDKVEKILGDKATRLDSTKKL